MKQPSSSSSTIPRSAMKQIARWLSSAPKTTPQVRRRFFLGLWQRHPLLSLSRFASSSLLFDSPVLLRRRDGEVPQQTIDLRLRRSDVLWILLFLPFFFETESMIVFFLFLYSFSWKKFGVAAVPFLFPVWCRRLFCCDRPLVDVFAKGFAVQWGCSSTVVGAVAQNLIIRFVFLCRSLAWKFSFFCFLCFFVLYLEILEWNWFIFSFCSIQ